MIDVRFDFNLIGVPDADMADKVARALEKVLSEQFETSIQLAWILEDTY